MAFGFLKNLVDRFSGRPVDWDELEEALIRSDIGVPMTLKIVQDLQQRPGKITARDVVDVTRAHIEQILPAGNPKLRPFPNKPKVILMVGVNGTGKTTSTAKLAHLLKRNRHTVMLAAADTFRAAAIEQLKIWADRLQVDIIAGEYNADPAALCYDAYSAAHRKNIEFLICDTAGRLHTKYNLMQELGKVVRTIQKHDDTAPHESLLVVDATTGGNALVQA
jgi:fused signal recognition particle receptor